MELLNEMKALTTHLQLNISWLNGDMLLERISDDKILGCKVQKTRFTILICFKTLSYIRLNDLFGTPGLNSFCTPRLRLFRYL